MSLQKLPHGSLSKRIVAAAIDFAIWFFILQWPILLAMMWNIDGWIDFNRRPMAAYFPFVLILAFSIFPFGLRDLPRGKGFGKWVVGLRVVDAEDPFKRASVAHLFIRNLTNPIAPVGIASAFNHPEHMRFGDRLGNTVVIEDPGRASVALRAVVGGLAVLAVVFYVGRVVGTLCMMQMSKNSVIHAEAVETLREYRPLTDVTGPIERDQLTTMAPGMQMSRQEEKAAAQVVFFYQSEKGEGSMEVYFERGLSYQPGWEVTDIRGGVEFYKPRADNTVAFLFRRASHFERFLTSAETQALKEASEERRPFTDVFPDWATPEEKKSMEDGQPEETPETKGEDEGKSPKPASPAGETDDNAPSTTDDNARLPDGSAIPHVIDTARFTPADFACNPPVTSVTYY